jgi:MOSC domain-containing protein YiiM
MPCFKLAIRFNRSDIVKHFKKSLLTGFYCSVTREGTLRTGDTIHLVKRDQGDLTVAEVAELYIAKNPNESVLIRVIGHKGLPVSWREYFDQKLKRIGQLNVR